MVLLIIRPKTTLSVAGSFFLLTSSLRNWQCSRIEGALLQRVLNCVAVLTCRLLRNLLMYGLRARRLHGLEANSRTGCSRIGYLKGVGVQRVAEGMLLSALSCTATLVAIPIDVFMAFASFIAIGPH